MWRAVGGVHSYCAYTNLSGIPRPSPGDRYENSYAIIEKSDFKNIYFSPNVGDAGGSIGAALYVAKENNEKLNYKFKVEKFND